MIEKNAEKLDADINSNARSDICFIFRDMIEMTLPTTLLKMIKFI